MRYRMILLTVLCGTFFLLLVPGMNAHAQEEELEAGIYEKSGAGQLYEALDEDTREMLSQAGVDPGNVGESLSEDGLFQVFSGILRDKLSGPLKALAALTVVIILCRLAGCFDPGEASAAAAMAGTLACAAVVALPLLELIRAAQRAVESASVFLLAAVPVYAALMAVSGSAAAGTSYSFLALAAGNAIPILSSVVIFPLLHVFLALALVSCSSQMKLDRLTQSLYGFSKWLLVLAVTVFSAVISMQAVLNAQVDAAANKAAKLIASSAVPIVGGAFGDAVAAIQNSVHIVKSGAGAFGILAVLCIFAPTAIETALWAAMCGVGQIVGDLFEAPKIGGFLGMCGAAARMILAVLASTCAVCVVSAAIVLFVRGGL